MIPLKTSIMIPILKYNKHFSSNGIGSAIIWVINRDIIKPHEFPMMDLSHNLKQLYLPWYFSNPILKLYGHFASNGIGPVAICRIGREKILPQKIWFQKKKFLLAQEIALIPFVMILSP